MPVYRFSHPNVINADQRLALAKKITAIHAEVAATPEHIVNVTFADSSNDDEFVGGERVTPRVRLHANVKAGRTHDQKRQTIDKIRTAYQEIVGSELNWIWLFENPSDNNFTKPPY